MEIKLQKCDLMGKPLIRNLQQLEHDPRSIKVLILVQYRHRPMCTPEDCTSYQTITLVQSPKICPFTFLLVDCVEPDLDPG